MGNSTKHGGGGAAAAPSGGDKGRGRDTGRQPRVVLTPGTGVPMLDKRGTDRVDTSEQRFDIRVGVASDHRLFVGLTWNISAGGLFIATEEPLKRGDRVDVRFSVPGSNYVFQKKATVCWTRPIDAEGGGHSRSGAGVQFDSLTDEEQKILNAFLQVHDAIFYDV